MEDREDIPAPGAAADAPPRRTLGAAEGGRIVDWLAAVAKPGARVATRQREGDEEGRRRPVRPRSALRAMRLLAGFRRVGLERRKLDHAARAEAAGAYALKDYVTPVVALAGDRAHAEAMRRGLDCAAALPVEDRDAIYDRAEAELRAAGVDTDPHGVHRPRAEPEATWQVPDAVVAEVLARLVDMVDPEGVEARRLRPRARLMAAQVLLLFERIGLEEERFSRAVRAGGPVFDRTAALAEMEEIVQRRLVERRR